MDAAVSDEENGQNLEREHHFGHSVEDGLHARCTLQTLHVPLVEIGVDELRRHLWSHLQIGQQHSRSHDIGRQHKQQVPGTDGTASDGQRLDVFQIERKNSQVGKDVKRVARRDDGLKTGEKHIMPAIEQRRHQHKHR